MACLCSQRTLNVQIKYFMLYWSIYTLFVLNRGWKRDSLQIIIFVYFCSKWSIDELKTRLETWITRNYVNGVSLFNLSYLITLMVFLCSQMTPNVQIKYFMFDWSIYRLFVQSTGWKRDSFQMLIYVNGYSTWSMVQLKTLFETSITRIDVYGVSLFHLSYLITLIAYLCSQRTPKGQINYFILDWSIYTLFVLNRGCKCESLQIFILVHFFFFFCLVALKTPFETWITRNDVNGVSLFHHSYLITFMAYLCSQRTPKIPNQVLYVSLVYLQNYLC
jgi:hypothetical protein